MRTRIDITYTPNTRKINTGIADLTIADIRLIVNETQKEVICSSMQKDNIVSIVNGVVTYVDSLPLLNENDYITFEIDMAKEQPINVLVQEVTTGKQAIASAIVAKGGEASADESLAELAQDITNIEELQDWQKMLCERTYTAASGSNNPIRNITKLDSPNVNSVGAYTFASCSNLREVDLANAVSVAPRGFQNCTNLQEVNMPNVTNVGDSGFAGNVNIKKLLLPNATLLGGSGSSMLGSGNYYIEEMHIGTNCNITYAWNYTNNRTYLPSLIKFVIGENWDINLNMYNVWTASTYLTSSAEQWANRLKLYENLRDYTISALYDHSGDGVTRTFRLGFYATLYADSQLTTEPYGSYYTPLIKQAAQDCIRIIGEKHWAISA